MFRRLRALVEQVRAEPVRPRAKPEPSARVRPQPLPPVFLFVDGARGRAIVPRIEALCATHGVAVQHRDIGEDDAMRQFVLRQAGIDRDDLPTLFVASNHLGGYDALVGREAAGTLASDLRKA